MKIQQQQIVLQQQEQQLPLEKDQQQQQQSQPPSVVRFAADVTTHAVMSYKDYTANEIKSCFYNKMDYKKFKHSSLITLKLNRERNGDLPADEYTMRGLECRTREGAALKKEAKRAAMSVACQNQNSSSQLQLAQALHQVTAKQQHSASVRGMCDEMEVREYRNSSSSKTAAHKQLHQSHTPSVNTFQLQSILDSTPELTTVAGPAA